MMLSTSLRKTNLNGAMRLTTHFTKFSRFSSQPNPELSAKFRGPVTFLSLSLFALAGSGVMIYYQIEKEQRAERVSSAKIITTGKASLGG